MSIETDIARHDERLENLEQTAIELHESQTRLFKKLDALIPAVARLEVKAGLWGGVGGLVAIALAMGLWWIKTM